MRRIMVLALGLVCLCEPALAGALEDGAAAYKAGDYAGALRIWQPLADRGDALARNNLGLMYLSGKGVPQDNAKALHYLSLSAAAGSAEGQNNLGGLYRNATGVPRDYARAMRWFSASAAQGNSAGMYNLGLMYELGEGMAAEPLHAYMWFSLAADQHNMPDAATHRDAVSARMMPEERTQARAMAAACKASGYKGCR
ncbi:MAG TPA: tetratricopeptide repeat protein [Rhizomicrobium sp.]|nr:tetratricopeptide repeat protein [Rhizomicrobium sp.]